jgi:hypothetical protein
MLARALWWHRRDSSALRSSELRPAPIIPRRTLSLHRVGFNAEHWNQTWRKRAKPARNLSALEPAERATEKCHIVAIRLP